MRGERAIWNRLALRLIGSSPHARGTRPRSAWRHPAGRFIPACAGNARGLTCVALRLPVHPRMRGERIIGNPASDRVDGSSPHARGTQQIGELSEIYARFIPACAGNASARACSAPESAVHPRMRGERKESPLSFRIGGGSSPHARGTHDRHRGRNHRRRFIPACAGNASPRCSTSGNSAVHPRMRGERPQGNAKGLVHSGSSPHARGTPGRRRRPSPCGRFIPACAGNARRFAFVLETLAVHPRMRGERISNRCLRLRRRGSSPHARGTLTRHFWIKTADRFIPACAGNAA